MSVTESWNGSAWTELGDLNVARREGGGTGTSSQDALHFAGITPAGNQRTTTEEWNGGSWTEVADLSTGRHGLDGSGTSTAALAAGGDAPGNTNATEEWSGSSIATNILTD